MFTPCGGPLPYGRGSEEGRGLKADGEWGADAGMEGGCGWECGRGVGGGRRVDCGCGVESGRGGGRRMRGW